MGTKGFFGFYYKGKYYLVFNRFDSFLDSLGNELLEEVKFMVENNLILEWKNLLSNIVIIEDLDNQTEFDKKISNEDKIKIYNHYENNVLEKLQKMFSNICKNPEELDLNSLFTIYSYIGSYEEHKFEKILNSGFIIIENYTDIKYDAQYVYFIDFDHEQFNVIDINKNHHLKLNIHHLPNSLNFLT